MEEIRKGYYNYMKLNVKKFYFTFFYSYRVKRDMNIYKFSLKKSVRKACIHFRTHISYGIEIIYNGIRRKTMLHYMTTYVS